METLERLHILTNHTRCPNEAIINQSGNIHSELVLLLALFLNLINADHNHESFFYVDRLELRL